MTAAPQPEPQPRPALEARQLVRVLGEKVKTEVLHGLDLVIGRGEFVAITGHSGSGKSTLLYLLGALDRPTSGQVLVDGVDIDRLDDDGRAALRNRKLGFVFQFHFLLPEFDAAENVMIPMLRGGLEPAQARRRAEEALDFLDMSEYARRRPDELSGGQQQRVAVARAIASDPLIVLADEPTGNLDSDSGERVIALFERLNRERGMTIVMVTHDLAFARRARRHVVLKDGRVVS